MNIVINKDIETEYRDEIVQGFSMREAVTLGIAIGSMAGIGAVLYFAFGVPVDQGIYAGIPAALLAVLAGFRRFQGMTFRQYLCEIIYERRTKVLVNECEAPPPLEPFTLKKDAGRKKGINGRRVKSAIAAVSIAVIAIAIGAGISLKPGGKGSGDGAAAIGEAGEQHTEAETLDAESGEQDTESVKQGTESGEQDAESGVQRMGTEVQDTETGIQHSETGMTNAGEPEQPETEGKSGETETGTEIFSMEGVSEYSALSGTAEEISAMAEAYAESIGSDAQSCEIFYSGILDADNPDQVTFFAMLDDEEGTICEILYDMETDEVSVKKSLYTESEIYAEVWNQAAESGTQENTGMEAGADEGD